MHFLFSNEGNRLVLDKVVPLTAGKELFASPGSSVGKLSATIWFTKPTSFIYYIGFNRFDVLKTF